ncbi:dynamin family protein [Massilia sp. LMS1-1-1.1]
MRTKKNYQQYLKEAEGALSSAAVQSEALDVLRTDLDTAELLIPIVGSFSAGKSSMLNGFIGRPVLPVGIRPETELAAELRYDTDERIEAIGLDGSTARYALDAFEQVKERAESFRFLRVYVDSAALQRLEPLVLVDMPGFGSAAISHNKAIGNYLARGAHFVAAVSVEEGNITRSTASQLQDIAAMGRQISVVLNKANLKPEAEVSEIAGYVADQIHDMTGTAQPVHVMGKDPAAFAGMLGTVDPEKLFAALFGARLKRLHFDLLENGNVALASLRHSSEENQQAFDELKEAAGKIERKRDLLIEDIRHRFGNGRVGAIVDAVGLALTDAADDMVAALQAGDKARLESLVGDLLRSTLLRKMKAQMSEISALVVHEFELELRGLDRLMSSYSADSTWSSGLSQKMLDGLSSIQTSIAKLGKDLDKDSNLGNVFKTAATVLAVATNVVAPIVELLIVFLPDILPALFAGSIREKIRTSVLTEMIPSIKEELRKELPGLFEQQLAELIRQVGAQFEQVLLDKQESIRQQESVVRDDAVKVAARIAQLEAMQATLTSRASALIFEDAHG